MRAKKTHLEEADTESRLLDVPMLSDDAERLLMRELLDRLLGHLRLRPTHVRRAEEELPVEV